MPIPVPPTFPPIAPGNDFVIWAKVPGIDGNRLNISLNFIYDGTTSASVSFTRFEMYDQLTITVGWSLSFGMVDDFATIAGMINAISDFSPLYFVQGQGGSVNPLQSFDAASTGQSNLTDDAQYYSGKVGGFYNIARISSAHGFSVGG